MSSEGYASMLNRILATVLMASLAAAAHADDGAVAADGEKQPAAASVPAPAPARGMSKGAGPAPGRRGALELQTTSVSGNRELPRVMVVVPWKAAAPATLGGRPIVSLVEEALTPVDPEVFRRELEYYGLLHGEGSTGAGTLARTANNLDEE